ncbi:hypothetical protein BHM03_00045312 [Ensete ventricosum]|nr:hypothetical protein BHM03_00045312 [Ensete ventricosum]
MDNEDTMDNDCRFGVYYSKIRFHLGCSGHNLQNCKLTLHNCADVVNEIDVKPDGSWRIKNEEFSYLSKWHLPDGSLCADTCTEVKPDLEKLKVVKQEITSEVHRNLKLERNRQGFWEVSKPDDVKASNLSESCPYWSYRVLKYMKAWLINPLAFASDDPSLQNFLPTRSAGIPLQDELNDRNEVTSDDWISLTLAAVGGDDGKSATVKRPRSEQQFAPKERMEPLDESGEYLPDKTATLFFLGACINLS